MTGTHNARTMLRRGLALAAAALALTLALDAAQSHCSTPTDARGHERARHQGAARGQQAHAAPASSADEAFLPETGAPSATTPTRSSRTTRVLAASSAHRPSAAAYGWPVKPFFSQHPVRGTFGDPRIGMTPKGITRTFHFGIDVSCPNGTPVYATVTGIVTLESFRPEVVSVRADDGRRELQYWHIAPAVRDGQHVIAYRTVVGHVVAPWAHVHFSEFRNGRYANPLRPGAMGPYDDDTTPQLRSFRVERGGRGLTGHTGGPIDLVVEAYDETPLSVPAPWTGKPVTPALLRWRVLSPTGSAIIRWSTAVDVRRVTPTNDRYDDVYARWTRQNKAARRGRYRFYLTRGFDTRTLAAGKYVVEVAATDIRGNTTVGRFRFALPGS